MSEEGESASIASVMGAGIAGAKTARRDRCLGTGNDSDIASDIDSDIDANCAISSYFPFPLRSARRIQASRPAGPSSRKVDIDESRRDPARRILVYAYAVNTSRSML